jgi:hypothetical protein
VILPDLAILACESIERTLQSYRFDLTNEASLQLAVATALSQSGLRFEREVKLTERDRIDFMFPDGIGLELKIKGMSSSVHRQLKRYARSGKVRGLILGTSLRKHTIIEGLWDGRHVPLRIVVLSGGMF